MNTVLYIGGGNSTLTDDLLNALRRYFAADELLCSSMRQADDNQAEFAQQVARANVIVTHSGGIVQLKGMPILGKSCHFIGPPIPMSNTQLAWRIVQKSGNIFRNDTRNYGLRGLRVASGHFLRSMIEFATHMPQAMKQLRTSAAFDSISYINQLIRDANQCTVCWTDDDTVFGKEARESKNQIVPSVRQLSISGLHDELVLRPDDFLRQYAQWLSD